MPTRRRRPIVAVVAGGSIWLGHGVVPGGAFYADHLEGWMNLTPIIGRGVGCGEWVGTEIVACVVRDNESPTPLLGLVMASTNTTANKLKEAITLVCVTHKHPLLIGGSKVNIKLHSLPIGKNLRKHILSGISEANNLDLPNKDRCVIF